MKPTTKEIIRLALESDPTVESWHKNAIMKAVSPKPTKKELLTTAQAADLLGVTRPTLLRYVKDGKLSRIEYSSRKMRYDKEEVVRLINIGA